MTNAIADLPPTEFKSPAASVSPAAIALWLAIQLTAIVLIVTRTKLWIHGGDDSHAIELMLVMQIGGAALLLPALLPNWRTTICVALAAIPFVQIASLIGAVDGKHLTFGVIALTLWLIALRAALSLARSSLVSATIHVLAVCISIGSVILFYLRAEFSDAGNSIDAAWFGPISAAHTLVRGQSSIDEVREAWTQLALMAILMCSIALVKNLLARVARDR